jgi:hypothetical protein
MAELKVGEPFGLDTTYLKKINWGVALKRVSHDLRSDFVYAPHLGFIYSKAGDEVIGSVTKDLQSGTYSPGLPVIMEVPKSYRMRVAVQSKRFGPAYSRPGTILLPRDRIFYQALADEAAPIIDAKTDHTRSFSHRLGLPKAAEMFLSTRTCWSALQEALARHAKADTVNYIVKIDIANFFGSINQHTLINVLNDSGYPASLSSRLEAVLTRYTGERSSRGIVQGLYPSDLFGNFYLAPVDQFLSDYGIPSARYVDDIYMFVESVEGADQLLRQLIPYLRTYDLGLNEAKSVIMPKSALMTEEPDLEALFNDALEEVSEQIGQEDAGADYGFQSEWEDDEDDESEEDDLELKATTALFNSISDYPGQEENIERFCLPLFTRANSDYAVQHVMDSFKKRPSMAQIYAAYLARFLAVEAVRNFLIGMLKDDTLVEWQKMWILAALGQTEKGPDEAVKTALAIVKDGDRHEALRAVAAIYVGRFGSHSRRKALIPVYATVSPYIQTAIYFASRYWPQVERSNARAAWSGHSALHGLLTAALSKK